MKQPKVYSWQPDIPEGHIRLYEDHTYRWYEDVSEEEYARRCEEFDNDPLCSVLKEEIQKEINKAILDEIIK